MNRFRISKLAEKDLEDIWIYLAQQNEILADQKIAQIFDKFPMLAQFPNMGTKRDELQTGLRSFPVKPYITALPDVMRYKNPTPNPLPASEEGA